jgi:uncharacterized membrane protein
MGLIEGEKTVDIAAPIGRCFDIAADIEHAPEWQGTLKDVEVLSKGADGRAERVETESDASVKTVRTTLRFSYEQPDRIGWVQEKGEVKSLEGWWRFEELGPEETRASYGLRVDPGRMLGLLLRGPIQDKVRDMMLGKAADGLKERAEQG